MVFNISRRITTNTSAAAAWEEPVNIFYGLGTKGLLRGFGAMREDLMGWLHKSGRKNVYGLNNKSKERIFRTR